MGKRVLVVDDEKLIVKGIRFSLMQDGLEVECAYDGEEALNMAKENTYDLILLDVMLPKMDGFEVCQQIREFSDVPIIMLTAKGDDMDKILGLDNGADDYITKPFSPSMLVARVQALLRRRGILGARCTQCGDVRIDELAHVAYLRDQQLELTPKEYDLLLYFIENKGVALSREKILNAYDIAIKEKYRFFSFGDAMFIK